MNNQNNTTLDKSIKASELGETYRDLNIDLDDFITIISRRRCWSFLYHSMLILVNSIRKSWSCKKQKARALFHNEYLRKSPMYGFQMYKGSIFLQAFLESMWIFIFWVATFVILILEIRSRQNLRTTYSNITTLQSQTATASVLTQIESEYSNLNNYGDDWLTRFRGLVIINTLMICLFIQDWLQILSLFVRKIGIKGINANLGGAIFIDFIHFVGAIYLIVQYCTYYDINRTLSRSEEKYYRMFLSTESSGVQPKVIFTYLIITLMYRMLYQMSYFETFGALVQIIVKMIFEWFKFLTLCFFFLVTFTIIGYNLFNDIPEFNTIFYSFNTMYQSTFGGFDFSIYANSSITAEVYGRLYLCIFLLGFAILIMNFLIAILSEVYSLYTGVANALHKREIIKLRLIYEPHKYYYSLVKAPIVVNFYMILMAPLIVIIKSERLNNALILMHYLITVIYFEAGLFLNLMLTLPLFCFILVFIKLSYISSKSKGVWDALIRVLDLLVIMITSIIYIAPLYISNIILETRALFKTNFIRIVGIYTRQYQYVNNAMDGSINVKENMDLDSLQWQKLYYDFKRFVNPLNSRYVKYNPTNWMISEIFVSLMITCMKTIRKEIQLTLNYRTNNDYASFFIPVKYVIDEFQKVICLSEEFRAIVFGSTYNKFIDLNSPQLEYLISALADKTLGGLESDTDQHESIDNINDDGNNLITLVATLSNNEQRIQFWRNKLSKFYTESNSQWIIDQFKICKGFLYLNSYTAQIKEINQEIWDSNDVMKNYLNKISEKSKVIEQTDLKYEKASINQSENFQFTEEAGQIEINIIDISNFIGPIVGFERKIRSIIRQETNNGTLQISKDLLSRCKTKNQVAITRFLSSSMSTCYSACNTYASKD